jgi:outer membrane protein OmpA-like peptidoglycan-associated protein
MASKNVVVIGYAESVWSDEYNLDLSLKRAKTVAAILVNKGVGKGIEVIYYEKKKSAYTNA